MLKNSPLRCSLDKNKQVQLICKEISIKGRKGIWINGEEMDNIHVFIVSDVLMFSGGLKSLLSDCNVEVVGEETDLDQAADQIENLKPDVIIWGHNNGSSSSLGEAIHFLETKPGLKIIDLSLCSNEFVIYQSAKKVAQDTPDLVTVVEQDLVGS